MKGISGISQQLFFRTCLYITALKHGISCAETVVKRLNIRVFKRKGVDSKLKGHFLGTAVLASLVYGLEHCAFGVTERCCLYGYFLRLAKRMLHLRHDYHLSYQEAEERLGVVRPSSCPVQERLRWTGHMLRSTDQVLPEALEFVPSGGARGRGRPRMAISGWGDARMSFEDSTCVMNLFVSYDLVIIGGTRTIGKSRAQIF